MDKILGQTGHRCPWGGHFTPKWLTAKSTNSSFPFLIWGPERIRLLWLEILQGCRHTFHFSWHRESVFEKNQIHRTIMFLFPSLVTAYTNHLWTGIAQILHYHILRALWRFISPRFSKWRPSKGKAESWRRAGGQGAGFPVQGPVLSGGPLWANTVQSETERRWNLPS